MRLAEIQATLQEQRILFLRQQMTDLERLETRWGVRSQQSQHPQSQHSLQSHRDINTDSTEGSSSDRDSLSSSQDLSAPDSSHPHQHLHTTNLSSSDRMSM